MRPMSYYRHLLLPFIILLMISCGEEDSAETTPEGRTLEYPVTLSFLTTEGDTVSTIQAALADDDQSRSTGLMDVFDLPENRGMLFIFDDEEPRSFWMANTPLALDIIFANADKEIVRIQQNTRPYSDRNVVSEYPAMYVVETNAGYTLRYDIIEGMKISFEY
jgi:uncharacterized protein